MGYTIYWQPKRHFSQAELSRFNLIFKREYEKQIGFIKSKGLSTEKYEWAENPMTNNEFEFMKTARQPYDFAVKKALIEVQKASNNGYKITCDDGFSYTKDGLFFDGSGYVDEYKPKISPLKLQLEDLPIVYETVGGKKYTNGEYTWNENKKPKFIGKPTKKLFKGVRGGIYHISKGKKVYHKR